jgi:serine/threonine-protein kinase HipA
MASVAEVRLWGRTIGAVSLEEGGLAAAFQYDPAFVSSAVQVSPIVMPLSSQVYQFPSLPVVSFRGLPGLLADSLPDRFGNALIDAWLATQGRTPESFDAIERAVARIRENQPGRARRIGIAGTHASEFTASVVCA